MLIPNIALNSMCLKTLSEPKAKNAGIHYFEDGTLGKFELSSDASREEKTEEFKRRCRPTPVHHNIRLAHEILRATVHIFNAPKAT